ncbi:phosphatase PAP2 family protein [Sulfitobacter sp.]|uniref:bifunctional DedA family/phosphatase PAP2 family protein n=1 Tax=Sulfitobacter sp. TaxID=1903071 RepID=UPI00356A9FA0
MPEILDQFLPSLTAFGSGLYWSFALVAMLEAVVLTTVLMPGTLAILAAGILARFGIAGFTDLVWFIAAGTIIGSAISFYLGRVAGKEKTGRLHFVGSRHTLAGADLLQRYGGFAMALGRFRGPLSGFVPFAAAMAGMGQRKFFALNAASAIIHAVILLALGYFSGSALGAMGIATPPLALFGAMLVLALGVLLLIWYRMRLLTPVMIDIAKSLAIGIAQKPFVRKWRHRHPKWTGFFAARFGTDQFLGLTATMLGVLLVYIAAAYAESVYDFLGAQGNIGTDTRLANLLYAMRDERVIAVLAWITDIGGRHGILPLLAGVSVALLILRRYDLFGGLWIAAVFNQITVTLLKSFFARPRSDLGYFVETSGSFPSGHAAGSVAVWGMLFYLAWRLRLLRADVAAFAAVATAFLIGFSRVYLVEHYLSDVLNGYLVGGIWLILGIAFCEWRRGAQRAAGTPLRQSLAAASFMVAGFAAIYIVSTTSNPLGETTARATQITAEPLKVFDEAKLPEMTEVLSGAPHQRVNLILTAQDTAALTDAVEKLGWQQAPGPSFNLIARAFFDDWRGRPLPHPLVLPTFWDSRLMTIGYANQANQSGGKRLHLRIWDSLFRTGDGQTVFVGTMTAENPLDWALEDTVPVETGPRTRASLQELTEGLNSAGIAATRP